MMHPSSAVSGRAIHPIFHAFKSRVSIYGFCLNEIFPLSGNTLSTRHEETKLSLPVQLTSDWINELHKDGEEEQLFTE